jgi:hypothetical protein
VIHYKNCRGEAFFYLSLNIFQAFPLNASPLPVVSQIGLGEVKRNLKNPINNAKFTATK